MDKQSLYYMIRKEDRPSWFLLQTGTLEERAAEAARLGVTECWETKAREDRGRWTK